MLVAVFLHRRAAIRFMQKTNDLSRKNEGTSNHVKSNPPWVRKFWPLAKKLTAFNSSLYFLSQTFLDWRHFHSRSCVGGKCFKCHYHIVGAKGIMI